MTSSTVEAASAVIGDGNADRSLIERIKGGPSWAGFFLRFGMVFVLVAIAIFAQIVFHGFLDPANLNNMVSQIAPTAIVAAGMTYAIIGGGFDLSVAAVYAAGAVVYANLSNSMPLWLAFVVTLLVGCCVGILNGIVITKFKVNAFIATLATASLISGATFLYCQSSPVESFAEGFDWLGFGDIGGVWVSIYVLAIVLLVLGVVLARTSYGRSIYAVGGNLEAARLAGKRTDLIRMSTFMIVSTCAALGGMITASATGIGQADIGASVTLDSIAIVIIGGTSLLGGEGAMWRTLVGILIYGTLSNIFASLALDTSTQLLLQGAILLLAVSFDALSRRIRK